MSNQGKLCDGSRSRRITYLTSASLPVALQTVVCKGHSLLCTCLRSWGPGSMVLLRLSKKRPFASLRHCGPVSPAVHPTTGRHARSPELLESFERKLLQTQVLTTMLGSRRATVLKTTGWENCSAKSQQRLANKPTSLGLSAELLYLPAKTQATPARPPETAASPRKVRLFLDRLREVAQSNPCWLGQSRPSCSGPLVNITKHLLQISAKPSAGDCRAVKPGVALKPWSSVSDQRSSM